jgi:hypothetical protein
VQHQHWDAKYWLSVVAALAQDRVDRPTAAAVLVAYFMLQTFLRRRVRHMELR